MAAFLLAMPNSRQNPSDLITVDHCSHFDEDSLASRCGQEGLGVELLSTTMLPKGTGRRAVAGPAGSRVPDVAGAEAEARRTSIKARCLFYFEMLDEARRAARACAWEGRAVQNTSDRRSRRCCTQLEIEGKADFFVDEDQNRIGTNSWAA